jgi:osmotically-inducible protein OsmY
MGRAEEVLAAAYGDPAAEVHGEALVLRGEAEADAELAAEDAALPGQESPQAYPGADTDVVRAVADELARDRRIDARALAVASADGNVTLRGTVAGIGQKRRAAAAARRVPGVRGVDDEIDLEPLSHRGLQDAHLRAAVLQALLSDPQVPRSVGARAAHGRVTLVGTIEWQDQRARAAQVARGVEGVTEVDDQTRVTDTSHIAVDVETAIRKAFLVRAKLHADGVTVLVSEGSVTLVGQVRCEDEHDAAVAAARTSPSVRCVDDRLTVVPR